METPLNPDYRPRNLTIDFLMRVARLAGVQLEDGSYYVTKNRDGRVGPHTTEEWNDTVQQYLKYCLDPGMDRFYALVLVYNRDGSEIHHESGPAFINYTGEKFWILNGELLPCDNESEFERVKKIKAFL